MHSFSGLFEIGLTTVWCTRHTAAERRNTPAKKYCRQCYAVLSNTIITGDRNMKCFTVDGTGLENLQQCDRPTPGPPAPGEVSVDVASISLNYRDIMVADGRYSGVMETPIIAGSDMCGTITTVGRDVIGFEAGDRVLNAPFRNWPAGQLRPEWAGTFVGGAGVDGVLAEQVNYPAASLVRVPDYLSENEASTFTIAGLTAWSALVTHGRIQPGSWVLLHGTGGVSLFGAQIASMYGARTVITSSSPAKVDIIKEKVNIDAAVDYKDPKWPQKVREITGGRGVDVVVDVAGGTTLAGSIAACAPYGRVGLIGVLDGVESTISTIDILMRQITIRGILMESAQELRQFVRAAESATVRPWIDRVFPFDQTTAAYAHLKAQRHIGKVVISLTGN